mmetsp:Transcript_59885/g.165715  ORF Transcript_59885/g.165715 Transcript_59885/m.165715 type:complete len:203 (+) Transcript_59885:510-1118(+)
MLDSPRCCLPVDKIPVHEGVLQDGRYRVDVILAHLTDVLKHETQALQDTVLDIQLWHPVLVHECRQDSEGPTCLGHNGNGDSGADAQLPLLHLQVVQQGAQDVVRPNRLRDVAKGVHRGSADRLLVGLEKLQQVKTYAVPLARRGQLRAAVRNTPHQVDAVFLHLLVAILEDRSKPGQQILDGRGHLGHAYHVDDRLHCTQD